MSRRGVLKAGLVAGAAAGAGVWSGARPARAAAWPPGLRQPGSRPFPNCPAGTDMIPQIEHIVVLMMENHSYDNRLGTLRRRGADGFGSGPAASRRRSTRTRTVTSSTPSGCRRPARNRVTRRRTGWPATSPTRAGATTVSSSPAVGRSRWATGRRRPAVLHRSRRRSRSRTGTSAVLGQAYREPAVPRSPCPRPARKSRPRPCTDATAGSGGAATAPGRSGTRRCGRDARLGG